MKLLIKENWELFHQSTEGETSYCEWFCECFSLWCHVLLILPPWRSQDSTGVHQRLQDTRCPGWYFHTSCKCGRLAHIKYPYGTLKPRLMTWLPTHWMCILWPETSDSCQMVWKNRYGFLLTNLKTSWIMDGSSVLENRKLTSVSPNW